MDAIMMLKDDHKTVEALFKRYEKAGDNAHAAKREIADRIVEELSVHAAVEEQLFYPVVRATVPDTEDITLESLEEHHIVKWVLSEIDKMDPTDERFDAKVTVLIENVRHHVEEEEGELFPKVRDELGRKALADLGEEMEQAKRLAPTHPHPRSPDTPPGNLVMGLGAGVVDRVGDTVSGLASSGMSAVQDVIERVMGDKQPSRPRKTATRTAKSATGTAKRASTSATRTAKKATGAARRPTKAAARTTKKATKAATKKAAGPARSARKATNTAARKVTTATGARRR